MYLYALGWFSEIVRVIARFALLIGLLFCLGGVILQSRFVIWGVLIYPPQDLFLIGLTIFIALIILEVPIRLLHQYEFCDYTK